MKLYIPTIGDSIILTQDWEFDLYNEYRNDSLYTLMGGKSNRRNYGLVNNSIKVTLSKNTVLIIDRIYIRKGLKEYNSVSFIIKKACFYKTGKLRFWSKLCDVNRIECDVYESK